jgi:hypothetical protein
MLSLIADEMKKFIADSHINELLNMRNMTRECSTDLRTMIDKVIKKVESAVDNRSATRLAVRNVHRQHGDTPAGQRDAKDV